MWRLKVQAYPYRQYSIVISRVRYRFVVWPGRTECVRWTSLLEHQWYRVNLYSIYRGVHMICNANNSISIFGHHRSFFNQMNSSWLARPLPLLTVSLERPIMEAISGTGRLWEQSWGWLGNPHRMNGFFLVYHQLGILLIGLSCVNRLFNGYRVQSYRWLMWAHSIYFVDSLHLFA